MGCVLLLCKYGAQLLLAQKIGCGSGFTVAVFLFSGCRIGGSLLPRAGLPSREAGLRVISSGGSLPTPPDFYCLMAVKSEQRIDNREEVFLSVSVGVSLIHDSLLSIISYLITGSRN